MAIQSRPGDEEDRGVGASLRALLEASPLAIFAVNSAGEVILWNKRSEEMFGWTEAETLGRIPPAIPPAGMDEFRQALAHPLGGDSLAGAERDRTRKDGSPVNVAIWFWPLLGLTNDVMGMVAVHADVTRQKLAAEERAAARFHQVFEATADAILKVDPSGRILLANKSAERMFGYGLGKLVGEQVEALIPERFRERHPQDRRAYSKAPVMRPMGTGLELWARRTDGAEFPVDVNLSPVQDEAGQDVVCTVRDMTERRRIEAEILALNEHLTRTAAELAATNAELQLRNQEVERADRVKSEFLASMSHELRTPLNAIIGFSDLLAEQSAGPVNGKQMRFVSHIRQGARHLVEIINDILDLSKIEAGRLELNRESFQAEGAFNEVLSTIGPLALTKRLNIRINLEPGTVVFADRVRFKQILYNLVSNAVKFTPEGGRIAIEASTSHGWVRTAVTDTGIGIALDEQKVIFEAFRQVGATTKGVREGTGLGLAITRRLVEDHGGTISVRSSPGEGSCFEFVLPSAPAAFQALPGPAVDRTPARERPLILIVDDEAPSQELVARWLEPEGYDVAPVVSGDQAIGRAAELMPDAITLNLNRPRGGWELLYRLKNTPATGAIPVVVISVIDERRVGLALGAADYLVKPIDRRELLRTIGKHVKPGRRPAPGCILVVDDDAETVALLRETLESSGYSVLQAFDGAQALETLSKSTVDAMILDLVMPVLDGFEVLRRLRDDPSLNRIPVFVLTGKDLTSVESTTLERHIEALFRKSEAWKDDLLREIRKAVRWSGHRE